MRDIAVYFDIFEVVGVLRTPRCRPPETLHENLPVVRAKELHVPRSIDARLPSDWPEKYFSGQSAGRTLNASRTGSVKVFSHGLSHS